jgi:acyl-CoA synthetase (AMP-forming)/AMP-acid ligase II
VTSARVHRLFSALAAFPEKEALVFAGRSWSFGELDAASRRYAAGLSALGIGKGDRVAVFAESSAETVVALLAHYRLGAIHVPINVRYRAEEAGHILRDSGARAVLVAAGSEQESVLREIGAVDGLYTRVVIGGSSGPGRVDFASVLEGEPAGGDPAPADEDVAVIVYTSGTTGRSKGAALSFRALVENTAALTGAWRFSSEDRLALFLPLFHVHGLCIGIHGALLHGMTLLLSARFDAGELVRLFAERGATIFMGVPTMYVRLLEHLALHPEAGADLARARLFTSGSAPLPAADFAAFERATGHRILERYGMTETLFTLSNRYDGQRRPGTVGFPVNGCDVRIVDDSGNEVLEGETGEILVRGNGMMTAYWGRPEETRAAFRDGWFSTGDVAARDGDGYVRILGRKSVDVIKSGGFKISAREIEEVLASHPSVREAAVVGMPDRVWGERIAAVVVLRSERDIAEVKEELGALCARSLADYKRPKEVRILRELPRNAMGKVQKNRIVEQLGLLNGKQGAARGPCGVV